MAKPVADIVGIGGIGVRLSDDWSWAMLPGRHGDALDRKILADLRKLGRYGQPVPNLYDTALAASTIVPGDIKWHADHSGDREKAIARWRREQGGPAGGPIPHAGHSARRAGHACRGRGRARTTPAATTSPGSTRASARTSTRPSTSSGSTRWRWRTRRC